MSNVIHTRDCTLYRETPDGEEVELEVVVRYCYYDGYPDTWQEPGQPDSCDIIRVKHNGTEITLTDDEYDQVETEILENHYDSFDPSPGPRSSLDPYI